MRSATPAMSARVGRGAFAEHHGRGVVRAGEDAIGHDDVEVHEAPERRIETLHEGDGARFAVRARICTQDTSLMTSPAVHDSADDPVVLNAAELRDVDAPERQGNGGRGRRLLVNEPAGSSTRRLKGSW